MTTRIAAPLLALSTITATATACYQAPKLTGSDQIYEPNYVATAHKDSGHAAKSWTSVDAYMNAKIGANEPGCAVGIARNDVITYLQGYGRIELGGPQWSVSTVGVVGSVSKTFTAAAALDMADRGEFNVNNSVASQLPVTNATLGSRSILELLQHTSGIGGATKGQAFAPNWTVGSDAESCLGVNSAFCSSVSADLVEPADAFAQYQANEAVATLTKNDPYTGSPHQGVYSNVGYSVLGAVIDQHAGGLGYEAWIWHNIGQFADDLSADNLLTLALSHSWRANEYPERAVGYLANNGVFSEFEAFDPSGLGNIEGWEGPAGGWSMTIGDLTRFAVHLNKGDIIDPSMVAAMQYEWAAVDGVGLFGLGMRHSNSTPMFFHDGQIGGNTAIWTYWPSYNGGNSLSINLMCNRTDFNLGTMAKELAAAQSGTSPSLDQIIFTAINLPDADGARYPLDPSGSWHDNQETGRTTTFVPISGLLDTLTLEASYTSAAGLAMTLEIADEHYPLALDVRNPFVATRPIDVPLNTIIGTIDAHDLTIEGSFTPGADSLEDIRMRGTFDARQVSQLVGRSVEELCTGERCTPCDDGANACIAVEYRGLSARAEF
ncbi:serine hydrolase domain-containing protein [Haliangium ochraceum]|nr:serine hydrolase domain-containing protein [Haliangium ochraceum]